jgi:predicted nucleic acid-binding protein
VSTFVIDSSIVIKWVVPEDGAAEALALLQKGKLIAPDLLTSECANILWKKVSRGEVLKEEALIAARLLQGAGVEIVPSRPLLEDATRLAIELDHPAYDCLYIALAIANDCQFVTADHRLLKKLALASPPALDGRVVSLATAASL